jgi:hypothetical protein
VTDAEPTVGPPSEEAHRLLKQRNHLPQWRFFGSPQLGPIALAGE